MEITEVRIKLMDSSEDRLRGFCSVTFDTAFVVRDLKIIEGNSGPFVAMPSRKLTSNCKRCHTKNHLRANYCNNCGVKLKQVKPTHSCDGRAKLYADVAHPINSACREMIQNRVIEELEKERRLCKEPGYRSRYDETYDAGPDVDGIERRQSEPAKEPAEKDSQSQDSQNQDSQNQDSQNQDSQNQDLRIDSGSESLLRPRTIDLQGETESSSSISAGQAKQADSVDPQQPEQSDGAARPKGSSSNEASDDFGQGIFD